MLPEHFPRFVQLSKLNQKDPARFFEHSMPNELQADFVSLNRTEKLDTNLLGPVFFTLLNCNIQVLKDTNYAHLFMSLTPPLALFTLFAPLFTS